RECLLRAVGQAVRSGRPTLTTATPCAAIRARQSTDRPMNHVSSASVGLDPVAHARDLGPAIAAAADTIEKTQTIPEPLLTQIHNARLARMLLPRSVDGDEIEPWVYFR